MSGPLTLLELAGYVGLLLWGTHMVTSGVQRGFGAELREWLGRNLQRRWRAFLVGVGTTAILQSSTATGLMATSFTVAGLIGLASALAVMLGANVGTALVTQVFSFSIAPAAAPMVLLGVLLFRSSDDDRIKNSGRISIGLGLMLLALSGLVQGLAPVENAPVLKDILGLLSDSPIFLVALAALLAWLCHSSVAVVLLIVSLAATHTIGPVPALALVLGANVGGTFPALIGAGSPTARRLPLGNAIVRLVGAVLALPMLPTLAHWLGGIDPAPGRLVVNFHMAFNLALAAIFILPTGQMARLLIRFLPEPPAPTDAGRPIHLESAALDSAAVSLSNASRETLRMADMVREMLRDTLTAVRQADGRLASEIAKRARTLDRLGAAIRSYLADLGNEQPLDDEQEGARAQEILSAVINLEHIASILGSMLTDFSFKKRQQRHALSQQEVDFIASMHSELLGSLRIAQAVLLNGDEHDASRLIARKASLRALEAKAVTMHVRLLREAATAYRASPGENVDAVVEESGLFLRMVGDLRRVHSHLATFAYAALNRAKPHPLATVASQSIVSDP